MCNIVILIVLGSFFVIVIVIGDSSIRHSQAVASRPEQLDPRPSSAAGYDLATMVAILTFIPKQNADRT